MNVSATRKFSCGTLNLKLRVESMNDEPAFSDSVADDLLDYIDRVFVGAIVGQCRSLIQTKSDEQVGQSRVNHVVSFDDGKLLVSVDISLLLICGGVEDQLFCLLVSQLHELHTLPALARQLQSQTTASGKLFLTYEEIFKAIHGVIMKSSSKQNQQFLKVVRETYDTHIPNASDTEQAWRAPSSP